MPDRLVYFAVGRSEPGTTDPAYVDIEGQHSGLLVISTEHRARIRTSNGKRKIGAKDLLFERYPNGINGEDRSEANRLTQSKVPISGPGEKYVSVTESNDLYTSLQGFDSLKGLGLRVCLSEKDRASDDQYISIAYVIIDEDELA